MSDGKVVVVSVGDESGIVGKLDDPIFVEKGSVLGENDLSNFDKVTDSPYLELPAHYIDSTHLTGFTHYYPFHNHQFPVTGDIDSNYVPSHQKAGDDKFYKYGDTCKALATFFTTVKPNALATGCVMVYQGFNGDTPVTYIRFERDSVDPITFVLRADSYDRFLQLWLKADQSAEAKQNAVNWCLEDNVDPGMQSRGNRKFINQCSKTFPLDWFRTDMFAKHEYDGLVNGDFQLIEDTIKVFDSRFDRYIAIATKQAERVAPKIKHRDHNLVLVFKGNDDLTKLTVGMDKVPPCLPENGEFHLGMRPIDLNDWTNESNEVIVGIRKVSKVSQWIDQLIEESYKSLPDHPYAQGKFREAVRTRLFASSHFIKELYQMNPSDVKGYVEKVANDIVTALNNHGGNIGLDLNSWKVWQYSDNGMPPVPLVTEELNVRKNVFDIHVDRFMDILRSYLYTLKSPYIRPYANVVLADKSDGIPIGSIRQAKPEAAE